MTKKEFNARIESQKEAIDKQAQNIVKRFKKGKWLVGGIGSALGVGLMVAGTILQPLSILGTAVFASSVMGAIGIHHEQENIEESAVDKRIMLTETQALVENIDDKAEDVNMEQ